MPPIATTVPVPKPLPMMPVPVQPLAPVLRPQPVLPPQPVIVPQPVAGAQVALSGDAVAVSAFGPAGGFPLPGVVPPGRYDVVVTFQGRDPFAATTLLVLDQTPKQVICRSTLGICKVR